MTTATAAPAIRTPAVPWYLWCAALAVTSAYVGGYWDISWHRSIGRDSFWSAPHMAIYACGVLAGISSAYLIFATTFGREASLRDVSVRIWGLSGPLGAFICAWGGLAMLASAPFDNWWHNAYGLDVQIISPPHVVLVLGIFTVGLGGLFLVIAEMNRATGEARVKLNRVFLYAGCMLTILLLMLIFEYTEQPFMHSAIFYRVLAMAMPPVLVGIA